MKLSVLAIMVLGALCLVFAGCSENLTGKAHALTKSVNVSNCSDTDGGLNLDVKGRISGYLNGNPFGVWDRCKQITYGGQQITILEEYHCDGNTAERWYTDCNEYGMTGSCQDGICVFDTPVNDTCTDTDGGQDVFVFGTVSGMVNGTNYTYSDSCSGDYLLEQYCDGNYRAVSVNVCYYGCENGACVADDQFYCSDSDGGINLNETGTVTGFNGTNYTHTDSCISPTGVLEHYCLGDSPTYTTETCPTGQVCEGGACIAGNQTNSTGYCGDGVVDTGEECDEGTENGVPCNPPTYGGQCTYCSVSCDEITLFSPYCGDGICQAIYDENPITCPADCGGNQTNQTGNQTNST